VQSARPCFAETGLLQVVENTLRAPLGQHWSFNQRGTLTCQSGSGNNWARGYHTYGPKYRSDVCELLRREARSVYKDAAPHNHLLVTRPSRAQAEACDHLSSVLFLQSMAGGTGAGFGSFVVESARYAGQITSPSAAGGG